MSGGKDFELNYDGLSCKGKINEEGELVDITEGDPEKCKALHEKLKR